MKNCKEEVYKMSSDKIPKKTLKYGPKRKNNFRTPAIIERFCYVLFVTGP
jgi:hypothetical protein